MAPIWTGTLLLPTVPFPSWPEVLYPHAQRVPSDPTATVWAPPPAADVHVKVPAIWMGTTLFKVVPSPNWPDELSPHVHNVASLVMATVCASPADTEAQFAEVPI